MISHLVPHAANPSHAPIAVPLAASMTLLLGRKPQQKKGEETDQGAYGPVCLPLQLAHRCQGAGIDSSTFSCGSRPRRFRGPLLLSRARSSRPRCRRECALAGDREADGGVLRLL